MLLHARLNLLDHLALGAHLLPGNQAAQVVHVQQRANAQHLANEAGGLAYAPALDVKGEVRGEKPVMHFQPVLLQPGRQLRRIHAAVP